VRICSFLPSATEIIAELGLIESLVGVSEECRWPAEVVGLPVVTAARIDPSELSSVEIDEAVRASMRDGRSLYSVDAELVAELSPDVIVTQDLCAVCAVSSGQLASACPVGAQVISLDPQTFDDVAASIELLAERLGVARPGSEVAQRMRATAEEVAGSVRDCSQRRVFFAEWLEPPFCAGHWLPQMIELAGGVDVLGRAGRPSFSTSWDEVFALEPELIVVGPCGFGAQEAAQRGAEIDWPVPAVAVDGDGYYSRPGPRLADGIRQLAHLFHPEATADPGLPAIPLTRSGEPFAVGGFPAGTFLEPGTATYPAGLRISRGRVSQRSRTK
jgi:iron complex transport system substrate-binding protein